MKKLLSVLMVCILAGGMCLPVFAAEPISGMKGENITQIERVSDCKHAWKNPSPVGKPRQVYNIEDNQMHWMQTCIVVCYRCGDYYYTDIDMGIVQ